MEEISDLDAAIGNTNLGLEEAMLLGLRVARDVLKARMDDGSNQLGGYTYETGLLVFAKHTLTSREGLSW